MKKWLKWILGIIGVIVLAFVILTAVFWSSISIFMGTEGLSGKINTIPDVVSNNLPELTKEKADWISWQGANGDNRSLVKGIIKDWSAGLETKWEVNYLCQGELSATWSAPVIQGNRLVVLGRDNENDWVFCLNPQTGDLLWKQSYKALAVSSHGTGPRATPFIDDNRVYTYGRSGDLKCWSLFDGKELWAVNVKHEGGAEPTWGQASSPLILGDLIVVQGGGSVRTIAYNKMTGQVVWKSGEGLAGYAAINAMNIENRTIILSFHGKGLAAVDAENGSELWNVDWKTSYDVNATTPIVFEDKVFITSGYKKGGMLLKVTSTGADSLWHNTTMASQHSDPFIIGGFMYGYSGDSAQNRGAFKCVNLSDGTEKWTTNDMGWGTCVLVDGHLLCCDIKGNMFLMKPDPNEFVLVTELPKALGDVKGPVWTKPVLANGLLYLRFKQKLVCYNIVKE